MASVPNPWNDPQVVATVIAAFAAVIYVIVTIGILRATNKNTQVTRDIFEAAHRPYVFVKSMSFGPLKRDPQIRGVLFEVSNAGSVPARDFFWDIVITRNGQRVPANTEGSPTKALFPNAPFGVFCVIDPEFLRTIEDLRFAAKITYRGIGKQQYGYSGRYRYEVLTDLFVPISTEFH